MQHSSDEHPVIDVREPCEACDIEESWMSPFAFGFFLTEKVAPHNRTFQVPDEQLDRVLAGLGSPRSF